MSDGILQHFVIHFEILLAMLAIFEIKNPLLPYNLINHKQSTIIRFSCIGMLGNILWPLDQTANICPNLDLFLHSG